MLSNGHAQLAQNNGDIMLSNIIQLSKSMKQHNVHKKKSSPKKKVIYQINIQSPPYSGVIKEGFILPDDGDVQPGIPKERSIRNLIKNITISPISVSQSHI